MPSLFEPCGLPQMTCQYYGSLPVVHNSGGLHDSVEHLSYEGDFGNGFRFDHYDPQGLMWAVDEAMRFFNSQEEKKNVAISRIMCQAKDRFNHDVTAQEYIKIYESMLARPLIVD